MDDYARGGHCKYSLKVHLIFVTKYRRKLFCGRVNIDLKTAVADVVARMDCEIIQMETDRDHIHILLSYSPTLSVSDIAKALKQYSTAALWQLHGGFLRNKYWKKKILWSDGYFACSIGQVSQAVIGQYIQNQG